MAFVVLCILVGVSIRALIWGVNHLCVCAFGALKHVVHFMGVGWDVVRGKVVEWIDALKRHEW